MSYKSFFKFLLLLLLVCNVGIIKVNSQVFLNGTIKSDSTYVPVEFVNVGIIDRTVGTVSNEDGKFRLRLNKDLLNEKDSIRFSRIGFHSRKFSVLELLKKLKLDSIVYLKESVVELDEVVLTNSEIESSRIGYSARKGAVFGFWNDKMALGGEHATRIRIPNTPIKLDDLSFNIVTNISDSILVRVNVYKLDRGMPGKNMSKKNIVHVIKQREGLVVIDLSPFNIVVNEDFVISLELLKVYGNDITIGISGTNDEGRSYKRVVSQDRWRRIKKGTAMAFELSTSKVTNENLTIPKMNRLYKKPKHIELLWDSSISMQDRDLTKELEFLDHYFQDFKNLDVDFLTFHHFIGQKLNFKIKDGNWENLKEEILRVNYDGSTSKKVLKGLEVTSTTLLFSDGLDFPSDLNASWNGFVFAINGSHKANRELLNSLAEDSEGRFIDLTEIKNIKEGIKLTKEKAQVTGSKGYVEKVPSLNFLKVNGTVLDYDEPIPYVTVKVKGSVRKTKTDFLGRFSIETKPGEILVFSTPGRETIESVVNPNVSKINITMPLQVTILDEVILEGLRTNKESPGRKELNTKYGTLDKKKSGFAVKSISNDKINNVSGTIFNALVGKFPGVKVLNNKVSIRDGARLKFRSRGGFYAAWDVDGIVYSSDSPPTYINLDNVEDITVMPGSWAAARYGSIAAGGIILISTKQQKLPKEDEFTSPTENGALIQVENRYKDNAVDLDSEGSNKPNYIRQITSAEDREKGYSVYMEQRELYGHLPHFYVEVAGLFKTKWRDAKIAVQILSNIEEKFSSSIEALLIMAFKYEEFGMPNQAMEIYNKIYEKEPFNAQNQRDLAQRYYRSKKYKKAWQLYLQYIVERESNLSDDGIDRIVKDEIMTLVSKHSEQIGVSNLELGVNPDQNDYDILIEWSNPNAEFELQLVNPEKQYYTWEHTREKNGDLFKEEFTKGYNSKSFYIEKSGSGEWMVNLKYFGNQLTSPTYFKVTLKDNVKNKYIDKLFKMSTKNVNFKILKFSQGQSIAK